MSEPRSRSGIVRLWMEKAENDLRNAEHTLTMEDRCPFDTVCYHAQQCVEKCLKGLLVFHSIDFPKTHDLGALLALLPSSARLPFDPREILPLNRYAIEARYPADWDPIERSEAARAVMTANNLRAQVRSLIPPDARADNS